MVAGLRLADHVAADVRTLGEDAAAETGEDRDQRGAEAEGHQRVDHVAAAAGDTHLEQDRVVAADADQGEAGDQHAGHRTRLEGEVETRGQALLGGNGGTHVGAHRDVHADEAGGSRQDRADQEADGGELAEQQCQDDEDDDAHDTDGHVLAAQVGSRTFLDGLRDFLHARGAGV